MVPNTSKSITRFVFSGLEGEVGAINGSAIAASVPVGATSQDEQDPAFDGHKARRHLVERLCFRLVPWTQEAAAWTGWRERMGGRIAVSGEAMLLLPPAWW